MFDGCEHSVGYAWVLFGVKFRRVMHETCCLGPSVGVHKVGALKMSFKENG